MPMRPVPEDDRLVVLYDADCGICTHTARLLRRLDRRHALELVAAQAADDVPGAPPLEVRLTALQVGDQRGRWASGGAAAIRIARVVPPLFPIAVIGRLPGGRRLIESAYGLVARNRQRISRALGVQSCRVPR